MSAGTSTPAPLPERLGRYEIEALLGRGGMGAVYKARDPVLERVVAVKTVGGFLVEVAEHRDEYLERFQREARAAARLSHPNIVAVHDFGVEEATGSPFIVMEYVPGTSLATVLRENPLLPVSQGLEILQQVAAALQEAHRHGVVHRDVKPGNVFIDPRGRVKVGDFGIARIEGSELTLAGVSLGTPGYLAPEVVRGARADARSDVFALGVLAYTVLAGCKPFLGVTPQVVTGDVLERDPDPPHHVRPELPEAASAAVMHALAKDPQERTPDAEAFLRELGGAAPATSAPSMAPATITPPVPVEPTVTVATARRRVRRAPWLLLAALAAALGLAAYLVWLSSGPTDPRTVVAPSAQRRPSARATPRTTATAPPAREVSASPVAIPPPPLPSARRGGDDADDDDDRKGRGRSGPGKGRGRGQRKGKKDD